MTLPPPKAMPRASLTPSVAAKDVRPFALVATIIPKNPEAALHNAPRTKHTAEDTPTCHPSRPATTITKGKSHLYSRYKNAIAPR